MNKFSTKARVKDRRMVLQRTRRLRNQLKQIAMLTLIMFSFHLVAFSGLVMNVHAALFMSVSGMVQDQSTSQGIEGVKVFLVRLVNGKPLGETQMAITDINGNYIFQEVSAGDYWVYSFPEKTYAVDTRPTSITVIDGENIVDLNFILERQSTISGTIYKSDGMTPASDILVAAYSDSGFGFATSDENGNYIINALKGNQTYKVVAIPDGLPTTLQQGIAVGSNENLTNINIATSSTSGAEYFGVVTSSETGQPIQDAMVALVGDNGTSAVATTDATGHYKISGLQEGNYGAMAVNTSFFPQTVNNINISGTSQSNSIFSLPQRSTPANGGGTGGGLACEPLPCQGGSKSKCVDDCFNFIAGPECGTFILEFVIKCGGLVALLSALTRFSPEPVTKSLFFLTTVWTFSICLISPTFFQAVCLTAQLAGCTVGCNDLPCP